MWKQEKGNVKSPYQKAVKKLDAIFQMYIRLRDTHGGAGQCCSCGKMILFSEGDAGHWINRRWMATRWREDNVHLQCRADNRFNEGDAAGYTLFMIRTYGQKHVEYLRALSKEPAHFTVPEIQLLIEEYKRKIKALKESGA